MEQPNKERIKILYVDDEPYNLNAFTAYFRRHPRMEIYTAQSGEEGLQILKNNFIHVVMSDQRMPNLTGIEFLEHVEINFPNPVRVIVTAQRETKILEEALKKGRIFDFHDKPWDYEYLEKMIFNAFEEYCANCN